MPSLDMSVAASITKWCVKVERCNVKIDLAFVVAVAENGVIGSNGCLPWRMPSDLKRFRQMTLGKPVIMGRRTFQSIGKALDGRTNIVVTRRRAADLQDVTVAPTVDAAVAHAFEVARRDGADEIMVIGGAQIYNALFDRADRIYLTRLHGKPEGDTHFPQLPPETWLEVACEMLPREQRDEYAATLFTFERQSGYVPKIAKN